MRMWLIGVMIIVALGIAGCSQGATYTVDDDGDWANYSTIQDAIDNATDGDTIEVYNGTYDEDLTVDVVGLSLIGNGSDDTNVNGSLLSDTVQIVEHNVTINGFNITGSNAGISIDWHSGHSITDNLFNVSDVGIDWDNANTSATLRRYDTEMSRNAFEISGSFQAIYVQGQHGCNWGVADVEIGNLTVSDNLVLKNGTTGIGIIVSSFGVRETDGGDVSVGDITITGNEIYGCSYGISFQGAMNDMNDVNITVGDVNISDNQMYGAKYYGVSLDYWDQQAWSGNTVGVYGDLIVSGNDINSSSGTSYGISISDYGYFENLHENSNAESGDIWIERNEIDVTLNGIYIYNQLGYYMADEASALAGDCFIRNNTVLAGSEGIYFYQEAYYGCDGNTTVEYGDTFIHDNLVETDSDSIYFYYYDVGTSIDENSSFEMGDIFIEQNILNSTGGNAIEFLYSSIPDDITGTSSVTLGDVYIVDNVMHAWQYDAISIDTDDRMLGDYMSDNTTVRLHDFIVRGNEINADGDGFHFETDEDPTDLFDNSTIYLGAITIDTNTFNCTGDAVDVNYLFLCDPTYDNATVVIGDVLVIDNNITVGGEAFHYFLDTEFPYNHTTILIGNITATGNWIRNCTNNAIEIDLDFGIDQFVNVSVGTINVSDNDIRDVNGGGIFIVHDASVDNYHNHTNGPVIIDDNIIDNCTTDGIYLSGPSWLDKGNWYIAPGSISRNNVTDAGYSGIKVQYMKGYTISDNVLNNSGESSGSGIHFGNVENSSIEGNMVTESLESGINLETCWYVDVVGNNVSWNNEDSSSQNAGIKLEDSKFVNISTNYVSHNPWYGVRLSSQSYDNTIYGNEIVFNCGGQSGLALFSGSDRTYVLSNNISNSTGSGIEMWSSDHCTFIDNTLIGNNQAEQSYAVHASSCDHSTWRDNVISYGVEGGFILGSSIDLTFESNQVLNNSEYGMYLYNVDASVLEANTFSGNQWDGLFATLTNDDVIANNTVSFNNLREDAEGAGIRLDQCDETILFGNYVTNNKIHGVSIGNDTYVIMTWNDIIDNCGGVAGMKLDEVLGGEFAWNNISDSSGTGVDIFNSESNEFHNNTVNGNNNEYSGHAGGFYVNVGSWLNFSDNVVLDNEGNGFHLYYADNCTITGDDIGRNSLGVYIFRSENVTVHNCSIWNSATFGVYVGNSNYNSIYMNEIFENGNHGVKLYTANFNVVYLNNFYGNGGTSSQAYDDFGVNTWDNGTHGNYWDDYNGTDGDGDGIGDTPYALDGSGEEDDYPLVNATSNEAPREVPEFGLVTVVGFIMVVFVAAGIRRRRLI